MKEMRLTALFIVAAMGVFCSVNWPASAADTPTNILKILLPQLLPQQGPGWVAPKSAAEQAEQQRFLTEAYARQQAQQESQNISQQDEILKIYSKDPWRNINNSTNYVGNAGWVQFQGKVQAIEPVGILFQGSFGNVLSISTETDKEGLITTHGEVSNVSETNRPNARKTTAQSTQITKTQHEKIFGDVFFLVVNFPYPAQDGNGFERMMAYDCGYITYTNSDNRALTIRKLDYGVPCIKVWSEEEIEAAYAQAEAEREKIEAEKKTQRELADAQAEKERTAIEEQRKAELAAIEAEKKAKIDKIVKPYQELAEKGDPFALRRMSEFYRDGYGFEKDTNKAAEYFKKADEATAALAKGANEENKLNALTASLARFNKNVGLADKGQLESIIIVGKCYRDGDGVQKDLSKAREYFQKASDMGSEEGAKLLASIP